MKFPTVALALALMAAPVAAAEPVQSGLSLTLDVQATTGKVMIALFDSAEAYAARRAPVAQAVVDVSAGDRVAAFPDLKPGTYAATMFHDVNGDGRMNTNPFGMPTEPYAFTNNAVGNMGPASWDRAMVTVEGPVEQTISLK